MPCNVLRANVRSHEDDDSTTYSVYILYQYEFNGQTYKNDRYDFLGGSSSGYQGKTRIVERYQTDPNPVCYVNPANPAEAILKRGFHAKLLFALFPLPFLLVGLGGIYFTLRGKKRTDFRDASLLRLHGGHPTVLKPKHSPLAKLAGMILVALFWNGIISFLIAEVVAGFRQGHPNWFLLLFSLPFVAVGLVLVGLVVYRFLALFNPYLHLEVSSTAIPLGGAAELRWRFSGKVGRISELTVKLLGIEQATYQRGTKTHTDRNTFYEMELYRTTDPNQVASGQVGFLVPSDTMHTFEADNNKVLWSLDVRGDIKRWPDVKESYPIEVMPVGR
jgi:cbb3-type cytochrome oxidase subunit 3